MNLRQLATEELVKWLDLLLPGSPNAAVYRARLEKLSDAEFDKYIDQLESGEQTVTLVAPNLADYKLDLTRNIELGKQLGHEFFERLWLTDPVTGMEYLTPKRYLVVDLPLRRQQQMLREKISIPLNSRHVDEMTGQPTGDSQGASLTFPELQVLYSQGFRAPILELIKFRGGDNKARQAMERLLTDTGGASIDAIMQTPTRVKSTETLSTLLTSMHLKNNL